MSDTKRPRRPLPEREIGEDATEIYGPVIPGRHIIMTVDEFLRRVDGITKSMDPDLWNDVPCPEWVDILRQARSWRKAWNLADDASIYGKAGAVWYIVTRPHMLDLNPKFIARVARPYGFTRLGRIYGVDVMTRIRYLRLHQPILWSQLMRDPFGVGRYAD